jgi:hypothetical protein
MGKKNILEIEWPILGTKIEADPLAYNTEYFKVFCRLLPFKTIQQHTLVTGYSMVSYCPANALEYSHLFEKAVPFPEAPVGTVYWGTLGVVGIIYGPCTETLSTLPIAMVQNHAHDAIKKVGRAAWESVFNTKELIEVEFRLKGG